MRTKYLMTILALLPIILWGTVYEDAENQNIQGWRIYDNSGENGNITNHMILTKKVTSLIYKGMEKKMDIF